MLWWFLLLQTVAAISAAVTTGPFRTRPTALTVLAGENATLPCSIYNKALDMAWKYNDVIILFSRSRNTVHLDFSNYDIDKLKYNDRIYDLMLTNVVIQNHGEYTCSAPPNSAKAFVTVHAAPNAPVMEMPSSKLQEAQRIVIRCYADGANPVPKFIWSRGKTEISSSPQMKILPTEKPEIVGGNSTSKLEIVLDWQDNGVTLSCSVSNIVNKNSPKTSSLTLDVEHSPRVTMSPLSVILGQPFTLPCVIKANPLPVVKWTKDGLEYNKIAETKITKAAALKDDDGLYSCYATNTLGSANASARVEVLYAPEITLPSQKIVTEHDEVAILCTYKSHPSANSVVWKRDGKVIRRQAKLSFLSIQRGDAGNYICEVMNSLAPTTGRPKIGRTSKVLKVVVKYAPSKPHIDPVLATNVGESILLNCSVTDPGYPAARFEWRKSGSKVVIATTALHTIKAVSLRNDGAYECTVRNEISSQTETVDVTINVPPLITKSSPLTSIVDITMRASLFCEARGKPAPLIVWHRGTSDILHADYFNSSVSRHRNANGSYTVTSTLLFTGKGRMSGVASSRDQLLLPSITYAGDAGVYRCLAMSHSHQQNASRSLQLILRYPPVVAITLRNDFGKLAVVLNKQVRITCKIQAYPELTSVTWSRNGEELVPSKEYRITDESEAKVDEFRRVLTIASMQHRDYGTYRCTCVNPIGNGSAQIDLVQPGIPEAPTSIRVTSHTWDHFSLSWKPGFNGGSDQSFIIVVAHGSERPHRNMTRHHKYNVTGRYPNTDYTITVIAKNKHGTSSPSDQISITTSALKVPKAQNVTYSRKDRILSLSRVDGYTPHVEYLRKGHSVWVFYDGAVANSHDWMINLPEGEAITQIRVKLCLEKRKEICSEMTYAKFVSDEAPVSLSNTQVIIVAVVCSFIIVILLIILAVVYCKWKRQKPEVVRNFEQETNLGRPHTIPVPLSGSRQLYDHAGQPDKPPLANGGVTHISNGGPPLYKDVIAGGGGSKPAHNNSYDSQDSTRKVTGVELNVINRGYHDEPIDLLKPSLFYNKALYPEMDGDGPPLYSPVKDQPHLSHTGSFSGQPESGYSTPEPAKPKKVIYEVVV